MRTEEDWDKFERYANGLMNENERIAFENECKNSHDFKSGYQDYLTFTSEIKQGFEYQKIRRTLDLMHDQHFNQKKVFILRPIFLIPTGIAASILLLITLNTNYLSDDSSFAFEPLANGAADQLKTEDESYEADNNYGYNSDAQNGNQLNQVHSLPRGTAFQLNADGYFITAKHVISNYSEVILQQKEASLTFNADVVYVDSLLDFALLKASSNGPKHWSGIPFHSANNDSQELGEDVFTLGYPKSDIVYTRGVISSKNGFESDTNYFEISLPANPGQSGAPLFNLAGEFIGVITAKNSHQESVTYVLKPSILFNALAQYNESLTQEIITEIEIPVESSTERIKIYQQFIFEVHTTLPSP